MKNNKNLIVLLALIIISLCFKLLFLNEFSLWYDELFSWNTTQFSTFKEFIHYADYKDVHPPLYSILLWGLVSIFGDSETVLKIPSLVSGLVSIPLIYILGKKIFNQRVGLYSAILMSFMWYPFFYSISVRSYSLFMMLIIIYMIYYIDVLNLITDKSKMTGKASGLIISGILISYTHYYGVFLVFLTGIYSFIIFFKNKNYVLKSLLIYSLIFIGYLPWLKAFFREFDYPDTWMNPPHWLGIYTSIAYVFTKFKSVFLVFLPIFGISVFILINNIIHKKDDSNIKFTNSGWFLLIWLIVPFYIMLLKAYVSVPSYHIRHFVISLPAAYIMFSYGLDKIKIKNHIKFSIISLLSLIVLILIAMNYNHMISRTDYRSAVTYYNEHKSIGDKSALLIEGDKTVELNTGYINYYIKPELRTLSKTIFINSTDSLYNSRVDKLMKSDYKDIWLIADKLFLDYSHIRNLSERFTLVDSANFNNINIYRYRK